MSIDFVDVIGPNGQKMSVSRKVYETVLMIKGFIEKPKESQSATQESKTINAEKQKARKK